jgi:hypothetical protein
MSSGREYDCEEEIRGKALILIPTVEGHDIFFQVGLREPFEDQDVEYHCVYQAITWYVVRGKLPNPTYDEQHYWYVASGKYSEVRAGNVPSGRHHFRLCAYYALSDSCLLYSDDVVVEIK